LLEEVRDLVAGEIRDHDHHKVDTPSSKAFVAAFTKKLGKPPENQAWGDYNAGSRGRK
jgi:hypothetical protein